MNWDEELELKFLVSKSDRDGVDSSADLILIVSNRKLLKGVRVKEAEVRVELEPVIRGELSP